MKNSLRAKLSYASGDIYGGGAFVIFSLLFMNFLVLVEGLPIFATTIIIFIGRLWDAITDPVMGRISDRTRSRFGRRRIFFLIGIVPVFLSFVMLFYSFAITSVTTKIIYYTFAYMFFGTAFAIVMVPYNAILSDMTSDYDERTSFTTMRMLFSGGAALLAAVLPVTIIRNLGSPWIGPEQAPGYLAMGLVFGGIFALCWLVAFWGTKEKEDIPLPKRISMKSWLSVFSNRAYLNFLGIFLAFQIAVDLVLALFIFYIDIVVLQYHNYEVIVGTLLVCSMIWMPIMGTIAKKKGKAYPLYIGIPIWMATTIVFIWLDSSVSVIVLCLLSAFIAIGAAAGNLSTWSMLTDVFEIDEICTGTRREGIYSGMTTFLRKFASGVAVLFMGFGFTAMGFDQNQYTLLKASAMDFDPAAYAQSDIVLGIRWMFVLIPLMLLSICLFFAIKNKVNRRRFDAILKGIEAYKAHDSLDGLTPEEVKDIVTVTGLKEEALWGKKDLDS